MTYVNKKTELMKIAGLEVDLNHPNPEISLYNALYSTGCAVIENHDISLDLLEDITKKWMPFFLSKKKYNYLRTDETDQGFIPINYETASKDEIADFKELYQTHLTGKFPIEIDTTSTMQVFKEMVQLHETVCNLLDKSLPENIRKNMLAPLKDIIKGSNNHLLRVIHYPPIGNNIKIPRAAAHTDMCLFTMVFSALFNGLEFQNKDGEWYEPCVSPTSIIIFNSEMIDICTQGHLKAVTHSGKG